MIDILLCEDDERYRRLMAKTLATVGDFSVVGELGQGEDVLPFLQKTPADLLLLDLELPALDGIQVVQQLAEAAVDVEILILTTFSDEIKVFRAIQAGAAGYLVKGLGLDQLERAIRDVMAGGTVVDPALAKRFWNYFASVKGREAQDFGLDPFELDILVAVARGLSNPEAAESLGASRRSIRKQLAKIYSKMGVHGRVEAAVKALRAGLIAL